MHLGPEVVDDFDQRMMAYNGLVPYYGGNDPNRLTRRRRAPTPQPEITPPAMSKALNEALALAKNAQGSADLLHEALVNAEGPQELLRGIIPEFRNGCRENVLVGILEYRVLTTLGGAAVPDALLGWPMGAAGPPPRLRKSTDTTQPESWTAHYSPSLCESWGVLS
ncbi:uncharacterized protein C8Q71DRAFT_487800 [Rhodofomes roseus]|uniref:Uncharacterized protein n=1 Tax=Rhodofomes roseus TaxID=34475 RepID=A0ABQ8JYI8_9APHY|nr:uncharacterized protein C8Q71DRAFT_487800 [Rhodofomes roseus]KAH9828641.1 hypothetical protein C8Q71DRAFT_487800 [Rhodofomes roseus]